VVDGMRCRRRGRGDGTSRRRCGCGSWIGNGEAEVVAPGARRGRSSIASVRRLQLLRGLVWANRRCSRTRLPRRSGGDRGIRRSQKLKKSPQRYSWRCRRRCRGGSLVREPCCCRRPYRGIWNSRIRRRACRWTNGGCRNGDFVQ
jgi:hypothetical protein